MTRSLISRVPYCFAAVAALVVAICGARGSADEPQRHVLPAGTWNYVSQTIGGEALSAEDRAELWIEIDEKSFARCGKVGFRIAGKLTTDPTQDPKELQFEFTVVPGAAAKVNKGIYKFEGDRLTICYDNSGKGRPTKFESPKGDKSIVLSVLERRKD